MIKCVIFDLDGVIVSTTDAHFGAWSNLFKKHFNVDLDPQLETLTRGVSRIDSLRVLLQKNNLRVTEDKEKELAIEKNEEYKELISHYDQSHLLVNVIHVLDLLKSKKIKLALGSASRNGPRLLKALGIESYFDYVVDPSKVKGKPNPDIFLDAMNHYGYSANECLGVEDSEAGIQAIKAAGMKALGIGTEVLAEADLKVLDFNHLSDEEWNELLK